MSSIEIISLIVTIICLLSFSLVFTYLFRHYYYSNIKEIEEGKADIDLIDNALYEYKKSKNKVNKVLSVTGKVFSYLLLIVVLFFFGTSLYSRFSGNNMVFGDTSYIVIATGSMSEKNKYNDYLFDQKLLSEYDLNNQFDAYDVIGVTKYKSQEEIKLYDVIAFKGKDDVIYVHRIIEIRDDGTYVTRGDSNARSDNGTLYEGYLSYNKIVGKYNSSRVKGIGIFVIFIQSNGGIITIISIVYCMFMFDYYRDKYNESIERRTKFILDGLNIDISNFNESDLEKFKLRFSEKLIYEDKEFNIKNYQFKDVNSLDEEALQEATQDDEYRKRLETMKIKDLDDSSKTKTSLKTKLLKTFKKDKDKVNKGE